LRALCEGADGDHLSIKPSKATIINVVNAYLYGTIEHGALNAEIISALARQVDELFSRVVGDASMRTLPSAVYSRSVP
jgi:hypothetical protein